jgi:hypothetical protein
MTRHANLWQADRACAWRVARSASCLATLLVAFALAAAPETSQAATITMGTTGGGLDQGFLCATTTGQVCPTDPTFTFAGNAGVSGTFTYNGSADTASFALTLTQNASFGSETLLAGSTFSASNVPVQLSALGSGQQITQVGAPVNGVANLSFSPSLAMIQGAPAISALSCALGGSSDVCGVSLGAGGLEVGPDSSDTNYTSFLTFNVELQPVPLPAALPLMFSGLALLGGVGRRRRRAAAGSPA